MGIRQVMNDSLPDIFDAMGEDAIFTPLTGDPITCKAFIDFGVTLEPDGFEGQSRGESIVIEALLSVLTREPLRGETFEIDGVTYKVSRITGNDHFTVKCACKEA